MVEYERNPVFKPTKSIGYNTEDNTIEFVVKNDKPNTSGISKQYDNKPWFLWAINVEDAKVFQDKKSISGYTGDATWFASESMSKRIEETIDGKAGVKVRVTRDVEEGNYGPYNKITVEKIGEGVAPSTSTIDFSENEKKLIKDVRILIETDGIPEMSVDDFVNTAKDDPYNVTELRARILYKHINGGD